VFFNAALVACTAACLDGKNPSILEGFEASMAHLPSIFGWALISATVGLALRIIGDRSCWTGKIITSILGFAWTLISYFVIPIIVFEDKNPIEALKKSKELIGKTWGVRCSPKTGQSHKVVFCHGRA
jgi:hypothetical protein